SASLPGVSISRAPADQRTLLGPVFHEYTASSVANVVSATPAQGKTCRYALGGEPRVSSYRIQSPPNPSHAKNMMNAMTSHRVRRRFASCCAKRLVDSDIVIGD